MVREQAPAARVERRPVDDPAAWRRLVELLADLIAAPTPDEPRKP